MFLRTACDFVGYWSFGKEEDDGVVLPGLLSVHHSTLRLCRKVKWSQQRGQNVFSSRFIYPLLFLIGLFQSIHDSVNIHCQSLHRRRIPGCLCVHSRGTVIETVSFLKDFVVLTQNVSGTSHSWGQKRPLSAYSYTLQVYPTATRALGLGTSSGMARVGALITPFVAQVTVFLFKKLRKGECSVVLSFLWVILQVMLESSVYLALSVYCCCCLLAAIASCALPIETTGRGLQESSHREWGQEMMGRASSGRIPHSSSGSQGWRNVGWTKNSENDGHEEEMQGEREKKRSLTSFPCPSPVPSCDSPIQAPVTSQSQAACMFYNTSLHIVFNNYCRHKVATERLHSGWRNDTRTYVLHVPTCISCVCSGFQTKHPQEGKVDINGPLVRMWGVWLAGPYPISQPLSVSPEIGFCPQEGMSNCFWSLLF